MAQEKSNKSEHGKVLAAWEFLEFKKYSRTKMWYVVATVVIALLVLFAILTTNYLFLVIIAIVILILFMRARLEPMRLAVQLTEDGVAIGQRTFYPWEEIKSFWIIYEPPDVKNLYLDFKSAFRASIAIDLENQNPINIRKILLEYLTEDTEKENESFSDGLSRMLKL